MEIPRHAVLDTKKELSISISIFPMGREGLIFSYGYGVQIWQTRNYFSRNSDIVVKFRGRRSSFSKEIKENILELNKMEFNNSHL